jgi:hypothetical protein
VTCEITTSARNDHGHPLHHGHARCKLPELRGIDSALRERPKGSRAAEQPVRQGARACARTAHRPDSSPTATYSPMLALLAAIPAWHALWPGWMWRGRSASGILTSPTLRAAEVRIPPAPLRKGKAGRKVPIRVRTGETRVPCTRGRPVPAAPGRMVRVKLTISPTSESCGCGRRRILSHERSPRYSYGPSAVLSATPRGSRPACRQDQRREVEMCRAAEADR